MVPDPRLVEERDHLVASIRDLDRELACGDIDAEDHARLREQYTIAAADVIRRLESATVPTSATDRAGTRASSLAGSPNTPQRPGHRRARVAMISAIVIGFAVLSGFMVARSSGQRGGSAITGSQGSIRDRLSTCQPLAFSDPDKGVACYAEILDKAPENIEALTYQGWAYVRAGKIERGGENFARVVELDPTYPDVRVFRAVVAVRARDFATAADELTEFYRNDPSPMATQVLQSQGLEREIFFGLQAEAVRSCWQSAAEAGEGSEKLDEKFFGTLGTCLDRVLVDGADDVDALVSRAFAAAGSASVVGRSTIDAATPYLDRALALDADNGNALVLRASLNSVNDRPDAAREDLQKLQNLPRPTISFLTGGPEQILSGL